ncbi:hypothetical protein JCM8547_009184 [Rhodosporidiobolus lusitaniae]
MDTPTGHFSPAHHAHSLHHALLSHEPEELPSLDHLDLNNLQLNSHGHHAHQSYPSRPHTPSRGYSNETFIPSPSSPHTDSSASPSSHRSSRDLPSPAHSYRDEDSYFPYRRNPGDFPPEIIALIIHHLFYGFCPYPAPFPNPDPYLHLLPPDTTTFFPLPARLAPPLDVQAKETLANAALVDKMWNAEATRALWRRVSFGFPRAFESVLRTIEEYSGGRRVRRPLRVELRSGSGGGEGEGQGGSGSSLGLSLNPAQEGGLGGLELGKAWKGEKGKYVERWRREGSEGIAVENVLEKPLEIEAAQPLSSVFTQPSSSDPSAPFSAPLPRLNPRDSPLLFTRSISFARFRTAGMKRSIRSGKEERFVTPERLLTLLKGTRYPRSKLKFPVEQEDEEEAGGKYGGAGFRGFGQDSETETETESESETPGGPSFGGWGRRTRKKDAGQMCQVGFSEYMDSAITCPVLEELLFRGGYLAEYEEPDEPAFLQDWASSASESDFGASGSTPYLGALQQGFGSSTSLVLSPNEQPFHYRHLQSSTSRSPDEGRRRSSSIAPPIAEEDEPSSREGSGSRTPVESATTPEQEHPDSFGPRDPEKEDAEMDEGARTPIGRRPSYRRRRMSALEMVQGPSTPKEGMPVLGKERERLGSETPQLGSGGGGGGAGAGARNEPYSHDGGYYSSEDSDLGSSVDGEEHEEERGRERFLRSGGRTPANGFGTPNRPSFFGGAGGDSYEGLGRGRSRFPLSRGGSMQLIPSYMNRSSSLPAPYNPSGPSSLTQDGVDSPTDGPPSTSASTTNSSTVSFAADSGFGSSASSSSLHLPIPSHPLSSRNGPASAAASRSRGRTQSISRASERSSSVPASASGRYGGRGYYADPEPVQKRTVQVLEGSLGMQPVRALDLCGCVSRVFVAGLQEIVERYKLGPPALKNAGGGPGGQQQQQNMDVDVEDEEDEMAGRRTPSVRSMRLNFAEERVLNRTFFPHLRRLGLASSLLPSHLLTAFVLSFPYLTHLDLASTLTSPLLLKGLALAGQNGIGGRPMRLKALSLARCRLITGPALLGLFCGDCPPLTTMAGISDDGSDESWGAGEVVSELTDLSLFGDGTYPCPLERPELRLVLTVSPAFRSGNLRTVDLSSAPMTDQFLLESFPPQPSLLELGLASCRSITMQAVSTFLQTKAPGVEVLDLSHSCPSNVGSGISSRRRTTIGQPTISIMELHAVLLSQCASLESSSGNEEEAQVLLALRNTNLRVVELDEKSLELVQGGAGDWKPIQGKGRRGWYVDTATTSRLPPSASDPSLPPYPRPRQLLHLPRDHPHRQALLKLFAQPQNMTMEVGWHSRKLEIMRGDGFLGNTPKGLYSFHSFG